MDLNGCVVRRLTARIDQHDRDLDDEIARQEGCENGEAFLREDRAAQDQRHADVAHARFDHQDGAVGLAEPGAERPSHEHGAENEERGGYVDVDEQRRQIVGDRRDDGCHDQRQDAERGRPEGSARSCPADPATTARVFSRKRVKSARRTSVPATSIRRNTQPGTP